jgi:plasmid stability protein
MATITLHDVPDEILNRLERRAQAHGRSLNSEMVEFGPIQVQELVAATERENH